MKQVVAIAGGWAELAVCTAKVWCICVVPSGGMPGYEEFGPQSSCLDSVWSMRQVSSIRWLGQEGGGGG